MINSQIWVFSRVIMTIKYTARRDHPKCCRRQSSAIFPEGCRVDGCGMHKNDYILQTMGMENLIQDMRLLWATLTYFLTA